MELNHRAVHTAHAPEAIGPYSQAVGVPELGLVFTSGQIGLDPATGELVAGGIEGEFRQVLDNLEAVLIAAGSGLERVVRTTIYMVDLREFAAVNSIYAERIGAPFPARSTVGVAALPKGARVEAEMLASVRKGAEGGQRSH